MSKVKSKKTGIARREILEDGSLGKLMMTEGDLKAGIRSAMRKLWTTSARRVFIESVRFPDTRGGRGKWCVRCSECGKVMGQSERAFETKKDGTLTKKERLVFDVDHMESMTLIDIEKDAGTYIKNMFFGKMRVLCRYPCHFERTKKQKENK